MSRATGFPLPEGQDFELLNGLIQPKWPVANQVKAWVTTKVSFGHQIDPHNCYSGFNLGLHVQDQTEQVLARRQELAEFVGAPCQWLQQVHSAKIISIDQNFPQHILEQPFNQPSLRADGFITKRSWCPLAVMTADCLPVLIADSEGQQVGVFHAGWRGLAGGILQNALQLFHSPGAQLVAWLGPAIGRNAFQVGPEVKKAFEQQLSSLAFCFMKGEGDRWYADLYQLARMILQQAGVEAIYGGDFCTYQDEAWFYSYRRAAVTGRMATVIAICPESS